jgi:hypothetical protein
MSIYSQTFTKEYQSALVELFKVDGHYFYRDRFHVVSFDGLDLSKVCFHMCEFHLVEFKDSTFTPDTFHQCYFVNCSGLTEEMVSAIRSYPHNRVVI